MADKETLLQVPTQPPKALPKTAHDRDILKTLLTQFNDLSLI